MRPTTILALAGALALLGGAGAITGLPAHAAPAAQVRYVSPTGSGSACSAQSPCSLTGAQRAVRTLLAQGGQGGITVLLAAGTYRLTAPWQFGPADSGTPGDPVVWAAAPGAHPVVSGGVRVSGWTESDSTKGIWSAKVPGGTKTRQVFVNGQVAPVAQASVSSLGLGLTDWGSAGFSTSGTTATWFANLATQIGAADVPGVEFVWNPMAPTDWEESECPLSAIGSGTISVAQPCWNNLTDKAPTIYGGNDSNITPYSLSPGTAPTSIENAYPLLHPGQWYLDQATNTLYYEPTAGQRMAALDVEVPRLESLVQVTGTLATPAHDISFSGLTFTTATWLQPSTDIGFAQVQGNLNVTGATNQGECTLAAGPAGSCPWGAFGQPLANVALTAADNVSFTGDTFTDLGGVGLGIKYGSDNNLIRGDTFTDIASSAIWLGCSGDPNPTDPATDPPSAVIADCAASPASATDKIGANEIMTGNTVDNNVIHDDAAGYTGAAGVTLLFTQHTTVTHNDIFNMPYDGLTSGAWQGHPDAANWSNTTNINADNVIDNNLFHNNMQSYGDGGDIYTEGNQGITAHNADGTIDRTTSYANGTEINGNVFDTDTTHGAYAVAPDVGSQWITLTGNVEWNSHYSMSSHWPTAQDPYTRTYQNWYADPDDTPGSPGAYDNTTIPAAPGPADLPRTVLADAGVQGPYQALEEAVPASIYYSGASPATATTPAQVVVAGTGFTPKTQVSIGGATSPHVQFVSPGFLIADVPTCAVDTSQVTLGPSNSPTLAAQATTATVLSGHPFQVKAVLCNPTAPPLGNATAALTAPTGWTVSPAGPTPLGTVTTNSPVSATFTVTPPSSGLTGGTDQLPVTATFSEPGKPRTQTLRASVQVQEPFLNLAGSYDNVGITSNSDTAPVANFDGFDGEGTTYSAEGLAAAGLTPGATVTADGLHFTWPDAQPATPDNTMAQGQLIQLSGSGSTLGFLTATNNQPLSGLGTVYYADGTTQTFTLDIGNFWNLPGQDGNPNNTQVAAVNYANYPSGSSGHTVYVFVTTITLDPSKTLAAIALPTLGSVAGYNPALHIFALSVG